MLICVHPFMLITEKKVLIPSKGPTQESEDDATLTAEKEYPINFTEQHKKLYLNYNSINGYIFVNEVEIYKFKSKYLKKIKKTGLYRYVYDFLANYDSIDVADVLDIEKIFNKIIWYKIIFGFI